MYGLSRNPSITPEFIDSHIDWKWDIWSLSQNTFSVAEERRKKEVERLEKEKAARKIWFDAWIPYWYKPGNGGYTKNLNAFIKLIEK